jgi:hypothetical protein
VRIAVMQPYFFPYLEYWRLIYSVDKFVIYDNVQFTKKSWIRRNRLLIDGREMFFSLPIKKDSDYLNINQRYLSEEYIGFRIKFLDWIRMEYKKAPYFDEVYPFVERILSSNYTNLFDYVLNSILEIMGYIGIETEIVISSQIDPQPKSKFEERLITILNKLNATVYINPYSGEGLYNSYNFMENGIELKYLLKKQFSYNHFDLIVEDYSIIDLLMFVDKKMVLDFFSKNND